MNDSKFCWLVTTKDGGKKTGVIQVYADQLEMKDGALVFYKNDMVSLTIAYGCWRSACVLSEFDGERFGIRVCDIIEDRNSPL